MAFYNIPFDDGKNILLTSLFTAIFIAFAKALKIPSILWCSFTPSAFIFKLHFAPSVNDLNKSFPFLWVVDYAPKVGWGELL